MSYKRILFCASSEDQAIIEKERKRLQDIHMQTLGNSFVIRSLFRIASKALDESQEKAS